MAAAILQECAEGRGVVAGSVGVWLDTPGVELHESGILEKRFPRLLELGRKSRILPGTGRCHLLTGAIKVLDSALYRFMDEYKRSLRP